MTLPNIETILNSIRDLSIKEALGYLVTFKIVDYTSKGFGKIKRLIQDKFNEAKYAFVPDKEQAKLLNQFSHNPEYKEIEHLVPKYPYIDLIRTGLLIKRYQEESSKKDREIANIKAQIKRRPNGIKLLKIANLPTTPYFSIILQHTQALKLNGYMGDPLQEKFDEMVSEWETSSKLAESIDTRETINSFIDDQIKQEKSQFFVLGMKSAAFTVEETIDMLIKKEYFEKKNYEHRVKKTGGKDNLKVEVTIYRKEFNK